MVDQVVDNGRAHLHSGSDVDSDGGNGGDGSGSGGQSEHIAITLLECGVVTSCDADAQDGVRVMARSRRRSELAPLHVVCL